MRKFEIDSEKVANLKRFFTYLNPTALETRIRKLNITFDLPRKVSVFVYDKYRYEFALQRILAQLSNGDLSFDSDDTTIQQSFTFAESFNRILDTLDATEQRRLIRRLNGRLNDAHGLAPMEFEFATASDMSRMGFRVTSGEAEKLRFDWLATRDSIEFEIECKHMSFDRGKEIHGDTFQQIADDLIAAATPYADASRRVFLFTIVASDKVEKGQVSSGSLGQSWKRAFESGNQSGEFFSLRWSCIPIEPNGMPELLTPIWSRLVPPHLQFPIDTSSVIATAKIGSGGYGVVVEAVSQLPDQLPKYVREELNKASKRQLTGRRPSSIFVHLSDLDEKTFIKWRELDYCGASSFKQIAKEIFDKRPHVHSIVFSGRHRPTPPLEPIETHFPYSLIPRTTSMTYRYYNSRCIFDHVRDFRF